MKALIMMLKNTKLDTYHPIIYTEHPYPSGKNLTRYISLGHRTVGFTDRQEAIDSIDKEITEHLESMGYDLDRDLEGDLIWDGEGIPADVQLRPWI